MIGDSETIIAYLDSRHSVALDAGRTRAQRDPALLVTRLLDDLEWVMSYSLLQQAGDCNARRCHFQGLGR